MNVSYRTNGAFSSDSYTLSLHDALPIYVEDGVREAVDALAELDQLYAAYAEPDADFDALAKRQGELEDIIQAWDAHNLNHRLEVAADALRLPPWDADVGKLSGGERRRVALCRLLL